MNFTYDFINSWGKKAGVVERENNQKDRDRMKNKWAKRRK